MGKVVGEIVFSPHPSINNFIDLTGQTYGRLAVLGYAGVRGRHDGGGKKYSYWYCQCVCGTATRVQLGQLRSGKTRSCGCLSQEGRYKRITHGATSGGASPEYGVFARAKGRCNNPSNPDYPDYGGRGIEFRFISFEDFLKTLGLRPSSRHSIDRIDVNGHYEKGNVQWATMQQQARNRRNNRLINHAGRTQTLQGWAEEFGVTRGALKQRLKRGWQIEQALTTPQRNQT
jgi:hypothetical protein